MKIYRVKQDIINGFIPNSNGKPNILFKKGDQIVGKESEKYYMNTMVKGIIALPTVVGAYIETLDKKQFVPFNHIDIEDNTQNSSVQAPEIPDSIPPKKSLFTSYNIVIWVVILFFVFSFVLLKSLKK